MASLNPYQSPRETSTPLLNTDAPLQEVIALYRTIGLGGSAFYPIVGCVITLCALIGVAGVSPTAAPFSAIACSLFTAFYVVCFRTGQALAVDPKGLHRRSRTIGFIMAVMLIPILTVPGLYCVWKLDSYYEHAHSRPG